MYDDLSGSFVFFYSERSINPLAAEIMLEETEHMIRATRNLFYALTVHSLIDYRLDKMTAGKAERFGDGESPYTKELAEFIRWFSIQIGGESHEQKAH